MGMEDERGMRGVGVGVGLIVRRQHQLKFIDGFAPWYLFSGHLPARPLISSQLI